MKKFSIIWLLFILFLSCEREKSFQAESIINDSVTVVNCPYDITEIIDDGTNRYYPKCINQTNSGEIFIGGHSLLLSKIGNNWVDYSNLYADTDFYIYEIYKDKDGALWFGSTEGLMCYKNNTFINYDSEVEGHEVICFDEYPAGNLWFSLFAEDNLYKFDGTEFHKFMIDEENNFSYSILFFFDSMSNIWRFAYEGSSHITLLRKYDGTLWTTIPIPESMYLTYFPFNFIDKNDALWVTTKERLYVYSDNSWNTPAEYNNTHLTSPFQASDGSYWFMVHDEEGISKISRYHNNIRTDYNTINNCPLVHYDFFEDIEGNILVVGDFDGYIKIKN